MRTRTATTFRRLCALALAACAIAASTVALPASSATATADSRTIVAGNARFQVLSPTLIRTEYAGDGQFQDASTFNAVGRNAFPATPFTSSISGGVLTIRTRATTLTYRLGSGPFDAGNLSLNLNAGTAGTAGTAAVAAAPWHRLTCPVGALCEAEDLTADGLGTATDHNGYTGGGFLAGFETTGAQASADVSATTAGTYTLTTRYANGTGGDGKHEVRTLSLSVDGGAPTTLTFAPTDGWDSWALASAPITLGAGHHVVRLSRSAADSGNVNVDSFAILKAGSGYPPASARAYGDCAFGVSCEAEAGLPGGSAKLASDHPAYAGRGFIDELNDGSSLTQRIVGVPADGTYQLSLRYANGTGGDGKHETRTAAVTAAGVTRTASFPATTDWDTWSTTSVPVDLKAGTNEVVLGCPGTTSCHVNLDTLAVTTIGVPAPQPHLALGGYRRGLDGVNGDNGTPSTTEGLLHRDGWYLLDDTTSALYDTGSRRTTQRPAHGASPYQDGYVFAFGHDYKAGLGDLATLTGPPQLLPRWAYGVWYSEYFDRTAADYRDTILPRFRANGVPLDVLVTDTDFKAPDTWNGWQFDRTKFPDPAGFFAWSKSQGLHNNLNVHPSIMGSDPQFAQAQATAKGKLTKSGCGTDCYVFDWSDPDQLKAYLDLHREMMRQGNDFWWLDWCCDSSRSSLPGVTPDAWINQQYADLAAPAIGRGFVISRAYGSLQAGGYGGPIGLATGPWADKRSTLHFTGDTSSTWGTLAMEVGVTPAESAATGMSAISHDIGGHNDTTGLPGSEIYTSGGQQRRTAKLPDDMYARWVQLGTFQPIDRLHSNHSDRLPWQYGTAAAQSATRFLNLRENLVPYTYTLAQQAATTGVPVVRPTYLEYPEEPTAYTAAGSEYFYGPDLLVAPVTTPGTQATTTVWFPPGQWTDYFTGKTYAGGTTQQITTGLDTMPVFLRAGGIMTTRTANVANDGQNPLTKATATVATGANGTFTLYEDNGSTTNKSQSTRTGLTYTENHGRHTLTIGPSQGRFPGQVSAREWTVKFLGVPTAPAKVSGSRNWSWDATTRSLTVQVSSTHRISF
ncbi:alpha-glucosidase (family GH31 glycosyl hydrolase) [Kribbella voronezhensis]|uniref:Alpha-glucosidase (Family GH31 glycosyl hydrolase) n=1 Tax=Kribbella voronezhensis TaxID=2512212 RepID=A0A4R7T845_9ACTN|nr:TIM-barrel domain-containing protein [Kribbella voronezhensis]TDU88074.1 alpha-glucosidase (family GH31 glycosyl hydrolase) [Kribbella voronezhensis]